jgi:tetratricopeptide (TPR) repeat protein
MSRVHSKPKLVFFQYKYDERLPEFLLIHKREHVKCLSVFFDVTVISADCDYQQICDKYKPDLALFESGVNHETCRRPKIESIRACPEIPKIALHNADGFCNARAGFLSDMDHWGIETFFAISITAAEHTPEIADNLFVWPVFADAEIYRDYGCWKSIPVLITGNRNQFYPWRNKIHKLVWEHYSSLTMQHPGYTPRTGNQRMIVGEEYARTLNASRFVPACGTVAKEVVRKHFEIPACKACLVAEKSPGLEAAGFVDMTNCVFADEHDVLDKLDYLFQNPDVADRITRAGHDLVHSRHTMIHRDQILQWFNLYKNRRSNERIVQAGPFGPLLAIQKESGIKTSHIISNGLHLALLHQGDELLWRGKYEEAERSYLKCISYMRWMPEVKLRLALCYLYKGNAKKALSWIEEPINFILFQYRAADPDPVEWAYYIITLLCLGKLDDAVKRAEEFPWLRHQELDRARWASMILRNKGIREASPNDEKLKHRYSIHQLPSRDLPKWMEELCIMLRANNQHYMATMLTRSLSLRDDTLQLKQGNTRTPAKKRTIRQNVSLNNTGSNHKVLLLKMRKLFHKSGLLFKNYVSGLLHRFEAKHGYFLPYYLSESRNDEFYKAIRDLTCQENFKTALVSGAVVGDSSTEAFLAGALENENKPSVFCIGSSKRYDKLKRTHARNPVVKWYELSLSRQRELMENLENVIETIRRDNQIRSFEVVLIDGSKLKSQLAGNDVLAEELHSARLVLLEDINSISNYYTYDGIRRDQRFSLVANNPGLRNGYAIFRRDSHREE